MPLLYEGLLSTIHIQSIFAYLHNNVAGNIFHAWAYQGGGVSELFKVLAAYRGLQVACHQKCDENPRMRAFFNTKSM
jgi:hypothetical protein